MAKQKRWTAEEIDYLKQWYGKKLVKDIENDLGRKHVCVKAHQLGLISGISKGADKLLAKLQQSNVKMIGEYKGSNVKTDFQCPFCGNIFQTTPHKIVSNHTKSCGCVSIGKRMGTDVVSSTYFSVIKQHAIVRKLEFNISIEYISSLLLQQKFKCALSGLDIVAGYVNIKSGQHTASLDRIDNNRGYVEGNVQWVHKDVNWMKQDFNQDYFIELCQRISNENKLDRTY